MNYGFVKGPLDPIEESNERTAHVDPNSAAAIGGMVWNGIKDVAHGLATPIHQLQEVWNAHEHSTDPAATGRGGEAAVQLLGEGVGGAALVHHLKNNKKKVRCTLCGEKQPKSELAALDNGHIACRDSYGCQKRFNKNRRKFFN